MIGKCQFSILERTAKFQGEMPVILKVAIYIVPWALKVSQLFKGLNFDEHLSSAGTEFEVGKWSNVRFFSMVG